MRWLQFRRASFSIHQSGVQTLEFTKKPKPEMLLFGPEKKLEPDTVSSDLWIVAEPTRAFCHRFQDFG
jgi:hypothetical protein